MGEQICSHIRFHHRAHNVSSAVHVIGRSSVDQSQNDIKSTCFCYERKSKHGRIFSGNAGYVAHNDRKNKLTHSGKGGTEQIEDQYAFVLCVIWQKFLYQI